MWTLRGATGRWGRQLAEGFAVAGYLEGAGFGFHVDAQHVVSAVIGDEHRARFVESNAVAGAALRQCHKDFAFTVRRDAADRPFFAVVHRVNVSGSIASGAFDSGREFAWLRQRSDRLWLCGQCGD